MALTQAKTTEIEKILNDMKDAGIGGGLIRKDGVLIKSTVALGDIAPIVIARSANISDAMMQREGNIQKEAEVSFEGQTVVMVPISTYVFFGITKTSDEKKTVLEFSRKIESVL